MTLLSRVIDPGQRDATDRGQLTLVNIMLLTGVNFSGRHDTTDSDQFCTSIVTSVIALTEMPVGLVVPAFAVKSCVVFGDLRDLEAVISSKLRCFRDLTLTLF